VLSSSWPRVLWKKSPKCELLLSFATGQGVFGKALKCYEVRGLVVLPLELFLAQELGIKGW
jgi:hypothetical protein